MDQLLEFCSTLCHDEKSTAILREVFDFFPEDISLRIHNEFCTRTLSRRIHPVQEDDIYMASHKSYRKFIRRERNVTGKATNQETLAVLRRIKVFLQNNYNNVNIEHEVFYLVQTHLGFPPSRHFLSTSNLSHQ